MNFVSILKICNNGGSVEDEAVCGLCDSLDRMEDCSDFDMTGLLRLLYQYPDRLGMGARQRIRKTILDFRYWIDEPGTDSMCYWSENHQILFAACQYLAGQYYPQEIFNKSGRMGVEHVKKAEERILEWLEYRWNYGFSEWHSNVYYAEDVAALCNLIDFCCDKAISTKAAILLDLVLFDMAVHSFRGIFGCAHGRCYEVHKTDASRESTGLIAKALWGREDISHQYDTLASIFLFCSGYKLPEVLYDIGLDNREVEIRDSMGLDLRELKNEGFDLKSIRQGMFFWGMGCFTNPETIGVTMKMLDVYRLYENDFFRGFRKFNRRFIKRLRLSPLISRLLNPATNGICIERANCYTYKTMGYSLSTAQKYHPGKYGDQHHIWQATLSPRLMVFTTHPASINKNVNSNGTPGYWVGSGRLPHSVQHRNISLTIYKLPLKKGYMEEKLLCFTHAYFPRKHFDETYFDGCYAFGSYRGTYLALIGKNKLGYAEGSDCDLIQQGRVTCWICQLGMEKEYGDFNNFIRRIAENPVTYRHGTLSYSSGADSFSVHYKGDFHVNGTRVSTDYRRFESPYGCAPRKPEEIRICHGDKALYLNFGQRRRITTDQQTTLA